MLRWQGWGHQAEAPPPPQGLYMYGGVGCGKTMLMDLLVEAVPGQSSRHAGPLPLLLWALRAPGAGCPQAQARPQG